MKSDNKLIIGLIILIFILIIILLIKIYMPKNKDYTNLNYNINNMQNEDSINDRNIIDEENKIDVRNTEASKRKENKKDNDSSLILTYIVAITLILIVPIVSLWKIFNDQGMPGWQIIVPILNLYRMFQIAGIPTYFLFALLIPYVGSIIIIICNLIFAYRLAVLYEKGIGYTLGLIFLPFIFLPLLAFKK